MPERRRISLVRWIIGIIILVPVGILWSFFLTDHWQTFQVISRSMSPTLMVDDYLIMRQQHEFSSLDNEIVVIKDPIGGNLALVKRVIASANSTVRLTNGRVYLDGSKKAIPGERIVDAPNETWRLGPDDIFVMGDNRNNSEDSRDFGPLKRSDIIGVITYRYWPLARAGAVK